MVAKGGFLRETRLSNEEIVGPPVVMLPIAITNVKETEKACVNTRLLGCFLKLYAGFILEYPPEVS